MLHYHICRVPLSPLMQQHISHDANFSFSAWQLNMYSKCIVYYLQMTMQYCHIPVLILLKTALLISCVLMLAIDYFGTLIFNDLLFHLIC